MTEILLLTGFSWMVGAVMGYLSREGVEKDEAYKRDREFFDQVMSEAREHTSEEAARVGKILAKRMADDILKKPWY